MTELHEIRMDVNGTPRTIEVPANLSLLDALRDNCGQTGAKECCAVGECGACTVRVDGRTVNSCLVLAVEADGAEVTTAEGLAPPGQLSPLQQAFLDHGAVQCGFCIPGMVMSAQAVLDHNPAPDIEEIREGLSGNLCRCAGYARMFAAMHDVAAQHGDTAPAAHGAAGTAIDDLGATPGGELASGDPADAHHARPEDPEVTR